MKTPNTTETVRRIESIYGAYENREVRHDVGRFLWRRFGDDEQCLADTLDAIKEHQEIRFGPPDVATVRKAIAAYEQNYGHYVAAPSRSSTAAPTKAEREEAMIDVEKLARAEGIDTTKDGWAARYFFAVMARQKAGEGK